MSDLAEARSAFAERLREAAPLKSPALVEAFARVPRESFVDPGPWLVLRDELGYRSTPDANPIHLYENVAVAIDARRLLNNGAPGFLGRLIDWLEVHERFHVVHIGCATGYYSAVLAELVGPQGRVTALELDPGLCERARKALRRYKQVEVLHADGTEYEPGPADAILVNAGVTHPRPQWLDALNPGGRLVAPLTATRPTSRIRRILGTHAGRVLHVARVPAGYAAHFSEPCGIHPLVGGRDPGLQARLREAYERRDLDTVRSLRRDPHDREAECWLHAEDVCLSRREVR